MLDTVLFEFDGVIADTGEARHDALVTALRAGGFDLSESEYREHCAGLSTDEATRAALRERGGSEDETLVSLIATRADRTFAAFLGKGVTLTAGARDTIERLWGGARLGIVSRAARDEIAMVLSLARLDHVFTCVLGHEDAFPPKPSPAPYQAALARLARLRPAGSRGIVVALEDSLAGIRSAKSAGLRCLAVGSVPAHIAMEADGLAPSLEGLTAAMLESLAAGGGERIP